jgi:transcriptional regulator of met regulon
MKRPKSFLEQPDKEGRVQAHFRMTDDERMEMQMHCLRRHRSVSDWLCEAVKEKMARELEADMHKAAEESEQLPDVSSLLLHHK